MALWALLCVLIAAALVSYFYPILSSMEWEGIARNTFVIAVILGLIYLVYKAVTTKNSRYWKAAAVVLVLAVLVGSFWSAKSEEKDVVAQTEPSVVSPTLSASEGASPVVTTLVAAKDSPAKLSVSPGWRWDIVKPLPPTSWTTDNGSLDERGNRIQIFEVVPPATEVALEIKLTKCTTPQMCTW